MIIARAIGMQRHGRAVLEDLHLHVERGEVVALTGPSGAGRTTLLQILATVLPPSSGSVEIDGVDALASPLSARRRIGYAPAAARFDEDLRIAEYLRFLAAARIVGAECRSDALDRAVALVGVDPDASVRLLSRSETERLAVAAALLPDAAVRLLDEPFSAQDEEGRRRMCDALSTHHGGEAIVIACNRVDEAVGCVDRIVRLDRGRVVADEPVANAGATARASSC